MNKTIDREEAKFILKQSGLKLKDYAEYLEINPASLSMRWTTGQLHIVDTLAVRQYAAQHSTAFNQDRQYTELVSKAYELRAEPVVSDLLKALQAVVDSAD